MLILLLLLSRLLLKEHLNGGGGLVTDLPVLVPDLADLQDKLNLVDPR